MPAKTVYDLSPNLRAQLDIAVQILSNGSTNERGTFTPGPNAAWDLAGRLINIALTEQQSSIECGEEEHEHGK